MSSGDATHRSTLLDPDDAAVPTSATQAVHSEEELLSDKDAAHDEPLELNVTTRAAIVASKPKKRKKKKAKRDASGSPVKPDESSDVAKIKIARNKHMRFISSYHGPWLQLPIEILDSLLRLNDEMHASRAAAEFDLAQQREALRNMTIRESKSGTISRKRTDTEQNHDFAVDAPLPPPIDPAAFRSELEVRRLIEAASDLAVRAASGLSAAALGALGSSSHNANGNVAAALGLESNINGRSGAMSATRQHRLRAMAVAKLAQAYAIDEVAASVAVMQGATALDDLADKVLKHEPANPDALYVGFFHEKIPSAPSIARTHIQSSQSTVILEALINKYPEKLHYYRSLGVWQTFRQEYDQACHTFSQALANATAFREVRSHYRKTGSQNKVKRKAKNRSFQENGASNASPDDVSADLSSCDVGSRTSVSVLSPRGTLCAMSCKRACLESLDIGKQAGDDVERQLYFFRGVAYFSRASQLIEDQILSIESVSKPPGGLSNESGEMTLTDLGIKTKADGKSLQGGTLVGSADPGKLESYRTRLGAGTSVREQVLDLLRKSTDDLQTFLSYFAVWETPAKLGARGQDDDLPAIPNQHLIRTYSERSMAYRGRRLIHHRNLSGRTRYGDPRTSAQFATMPSLLTTYHPLIVEAHFSVLLNLLLMGDFAALLQHHYHTCRLMEHVDGYPVFVPARSLNQSQYSEVMELLACAWKRTGEENGRPSPPDMPEDDIQSLGDLAALSHLLGYFTDEHNERIDQAAQEAEKQAAAAASTVVKSRKTAELARSDKDRRTFQELAMEERKRAGTQGSKMLAGPVYNTARAEVAVAWLVAAILPFKEAQDPPVQQNFSNRGESGSNVGHASASGAPISTSSTQIDPPFVHNTPASDNKGKGKGKAIY